MALNKIKNNASWGESASSLNSNFESIEADLTKVKNATTRCKGYFISGDELKTAYPSAHVGDYAYIGTAYPFYIWKWNGSSWGNTGNTGGDQDVNLENYYNKTDTDAKLSELDSVQGVFNVFAYLKDSTSKTLTEAAAVVPKKYRNSCSSIVFKNNGIVRRYEYIGTAFGVDDVYWIDESYWKEITNFTPASNFEGDLKPLFLDNRMVRKNTTSLLKKLKEGASPFSYNTGRCILLKVSPGDTITCSNIIGGETSARAWIKYDANGVEISSAEASVILNETITIDYEGYIAINNSSMANKFECQGTLASMQNTLAIFNTIALSEKLDSLLPSLSDNSVFNSLVPELVLLGEYKDKTISQITISDCFEYEGAFYNTVRLHFSDKTNVNLYSKSFSSLEEAQADITKDGRIIGKDSVGYVYFKSIGMNDQKTFKVMFKRPLELLYNPIIYSYLNKKDTESLLQDYSFINTEESIAGEVGYSHSIILGETPAKQEYKGYTTFVVDGLKEGDSVLASLKSGSSFKVYGKIKDGIVVDTSTSATVNTEIKCDGTFDSIIFNNYNAYVNTPSVVVYRHVAVKEDLAKLKEKVENIKDELEEGKKKLKILCFGNSFTQDSMSYVPFILKNIAPNVELTLGIAYIGGCPLVQHCVNFTNTSMTLGSTTYNVKDYSLQKYKAGAIKWETEGSMNVEALLSNEDWDIVTFQQNGTNSDSDWDTYYAPYIFKIHKALAEKVTKPVKLGWLSVHGSYKSTFESLLEKWQGTVENTQKVQSLTGNEVVFPFGTAIQNLRTTPLVNLGDGGFLMGDTAHIHEGIGCLAAAYVNALKIAELAGCSAASIIGEKTRPTKEWCTSIGVPSPNYGETTNDVVGISENNCYTAQIAAIMAVKKPFEVTDCSVFYNE